MTVALREKHNKVWVNQDTCFFYVNSKKDTFVVVGPIEHWFSSAIENTSGIRCGFYDHSGDYMWSLEDTYGDNYNLIPGQAELIDRFNSVVLYLDDDRYIKYYLHVEYSREKGFIYHEQKNDSLFIKRHDTNEPKRVSDATDFISLAQDYLYGLEQIMSSLVNDNPKLHKIDLYTPIYYNDKE